MAKKPTLWRRFGLLFALYFCQGLPGGFLAVVLPAVLREQGLDLTTIGLASALSLPWMLKILWAPLVDRYGSQSFGRRRSWLVPAQLGMLVVTLAFVFVRPEDSLLAVVVLFLVLNTFAATQDIAVDGWAVDLLGPDELGPGNGAQIAGFKLGNLVGGGVLVALIGIVGWAGDFVIMAALIFVAMVFVLFTREAPSPPGASLREVLGQLWASVRSQGAMFWLFVVYAKFGETFGGAMTKPMLIDHHVTKAQIGVIDGTLGAVATFTGAFLAGFAVRRFGWGRVLGVCSCIQGAALVAIGVHQAGAFDLTTFAVINAVENFGGGGVGVCIFAVVMARADPRVGATNFTAAQVMYMSGAFLAAPLAGVGADARGYLPVMVAGGVMALVLGLLSPAAQRRFDTLPR